MATPKILNRDEIAGYGVNPDAAEGWDNANNRYNTNQQGTYLYHGDLGGGNIGWYAGASPYNAQAPATPGGPVSAPGDVPANTVDPLNQQAQKSQTYSDTPGAAPTQTTTNQGSQDVVRNSLLRQATQDTTVDTSDPNFRQQADTYAAAAERARRNAASENAAKYAGTGSGAQDVQQRMIDERSAQNVGSFEAALVGQELKNKREEIASAIDKLSGLISGDQMRALQKQLADIDAQIKQASLDQSTALGSRELDIKSALGQGGLNVDLMRLLLQNQQFNNELGFNIADREAAYDQSALLALLGH